MDIIISICSFHETFAYDFVYDQFFFLILDDI